jgi:NAD(P) transhydrogenase subunit alpha
LSQTRHVNHAGASKKPKRGLMRIAVLRETTARERRVALVPATVQRLVGQQHQVVVEREAGTSAFYLTRSYADVGAEVAADAKSALTGAQVVVKVQPPTASEVKLIARDAILISLLSPHASGQLLELLAAGGITSLALELVPRTTKAQTMDVLSSQATIAGYQAVLVGASRMGRLLPMLTTAAGTLTPGKVFVIGAGVAGLQAIATARRLGAVVSAFDVRPVVKEQVESLGAKFVEGGAQAEGTGGYAKELTAGQQERVLETIGNHIGDMDLVIATAAIPGKPAPRLITRAMVESMRPGSVIVDLAADTGGNCEATVADGEATVNGSTIIGPLNLASSLPFHASSMFSRNVQALLDHGTKEGVFQANMEDPIVGPMAVTHAGAVRYQRS